MLTLICRADLQISPDSYREADGRFQALIGLYFFAASFLNHFFVNFVFSVGTKSNIYARVNQ